MGTVGMLLAVGVTLIALATSGTVHVSTAGLGVMGGAIAVGALVGSMLAARVAMTSMPELVAILHSFVGLAAVLVRLGTAIEGRMPDVPHVIETYVGVLVGAITFTGSIVAFLKLRGTIGSKPLVLPGRHVINALALASCVALMIVGGHGPGAVFHLLGVT